MKNNKFNFLLLSLIILGCQKSPVAVAVNDKKAAVTTSITAKAGALTPVTDAVRGQAKRILKPSFFPNSTFALLGDSISGVETTVLDNGDKLTVTNSGFEYFTLSFRFETTRFQHDKSDVPFWCRKAIEMMQAIEPGLDSPLKIKQGTTKFLEFLNGDAKNSYANVVKGKEIDYGGDEIREFVWLNRIDKIDDKRIFLEISYSLGPL